jgi:tetratricopeptide (TPR) repeat protein
LAELKRHGRAQTEARRFRDATVQAFPTFSVTFTLAYADISAQNDRIAEADSVLGLYDTVSDTLDDMSKAPYHLAKGLVALKKNDPETALRHLKIADGLDPEDFQIRFRLARAHLMGRRVDEAITILEDILRRHDGDRIFLPVESVRAYYVLGAAYQEAGKNDDAIEQFRTFLEIWKDADPELEEVSDAKKRLEELGASS